MKSRETSWPHPLDLCVRGKDLDRDDKNKMMQFEVVRLLDSTSNFDLAELDFVQ